MEKDPVVINTQNNLYDHVHKLNFIGDLLTINKDFLLGFILKDANNLKPSIINDLTSVIQLLIDLRDCQVITKEILLEFVVVLSHVCNNLQKHNINNLMQFYEESFDEVTANPNYFKTKYFKNQRHEGKIVRNIYEPNIKSKIMENIFKIQEKMHSIQEIKSKIQQKKLKSNISQLRVAELIRSKSDLAQCPICLVEVNYENISILSCSHIYHKQCFENSMRQSILNKRFPLKCPLEDCTKPIQTNDVEEYLSKDLIEKYYQFTLHNFVDKNSKNMAWCPTPGCNNAFEFDEYTTELNCIKCSKNYCLRCKTDSHPDITCQQNKQAMNLSEQDRQFLKFVKGAKYKQCPECKFWVQKNKGCCHMTCRCSYEFCYVCGSKHGQCNCQSEYANYYGSPDDSEIEEEMNQDSEEQANSDSQVRVQIARQIYVDRQRRERANSM